MKVITRKVVIENSDYVLIKDASPELADVGYPNGEYYATIPYADIDEHGKLTRRLNGFELCIAETIANAIERRRVSKLLDKFLADNPNATPQDMAMFYKSL